MSTFYRVLLLLFIAANSFYQPWFMGDGKEQVYKLVLYSLVAILLFYFTLIQKKNKEGGYGKTDRSILWLFVLMLMSVLNTFLFKNQPLFLGLMAILPTFCVYCVYFFLRRGAPAQKELERIVLVMGFLYVFLAIIDALLLPNIPFGRFIIDENRGGIRFILPGVFWDGLLFFYLISKVKQTKSKLFFLLAIVSYVALWILLSRQVIIVSTVIGIIYIIHGKRIGKKIWAIILGGLLAIFIVPRIPQIQSLIEVTKLQQEMNEQQNEEDSRIRDYKFFVYENPRNVFQFLFGSGIGSYPESEYGREIKKWEDDSHLIAADTSWAGFFYYYGFCATLILLFLIIRSLRLKIPNQYLFLKYQIVFLALCAITSGNLIYYNEYMIYMFCFYFIEKVRIRNIDISENSLLLDSR